MGRLSGASIPSADPEVFVIIDEPTHPLYDDRIHLPVDEALVLNIMARGVIEPVKVRRDGDKLEVIDGRQRTRAAREANRRLRAAGNMPHMVHFIAKRGTDAEVMGIMASTFVRQDDTPIGRAHKMQKHVEIGRSEDQIAVDFGCSAATVRNHLALLDCAPAVQKAVERGELTATVARKLSALPRAEQADALAKMKAEGATKGAKATAAAAKATKGKAGGAMTSATLGKRSIAGIVSRLNEKPFDDGFEPSALAAMALEYAFGLSDRFGTAYPWHATGEGSSP